MKGRIVIIFFAIWFFPKFSLSQNERAKWYFGNQAGLDFMTTPPTVLTNGAMNQWEGCASIANGAGTLLFYSDGSTIWNASHVTMANGTGLLGNSSATQGSIIIRLPGSTTLYYVFSLGAGSNASFYYSIVDMSLAAGAGSVTTKNVLVHNGGLSEKLTYIRHCNGTDFWIIVAESNVNGSYKAFQLSSAGLNLTPVVSSGIIPGATSSGTLKGSPNGHYLASARNSSSQTCDLFSFNPSNGQVAFLYNLSNSIASYGCEFSPDGTKLYAAGYGSAYRIIQWDLCAGSASAVAASVFTISSTGLTGAMQIGPDGKIYCTKDNSAYMGVINNPNIAGTGCNYVDVAITLTPKNGRLGLPNFTSEYKPLQSPFTYTASNSFGCQTAMFTSPSIVTTFTQANCSALGYSLTSFYWNFGDPASGTNNISSLTNPSHAFTALGTYTVKLVLNFSCGGGSDTITSLVNINQPCISVTSTSITCANLGSATVQASGGIGPYSYTWMPSAQSGSVATGLSPGTYTLTVFDFGNNFTYTATTLFTSLVPLTGNINTGSSVPCNGASTATGNVTNLAGGSSIQNFSWFNGTTNYTTQSTNSLSAGIWSITVTDALTSCSFWTSFLITQPTPLNLSLSTSSNSACVNSSLFLSGFINGGTPGLLIPYTYTWSGGPTTNSYVTTQSLGGLYTYTLSSRDSLNCQTSKTIAVNFINTPTVSVVSASACPLALGSITANGATTYTWNNTVTGPVLTSTSSGASVFTVAGSALGCSATATGTIGLYPIPSPTVLSNSPVCNGQLLQLVASGGQNYVWTGPMAYSNNSSTINLINASPQQSGTYNLLVTSGVGCTNTAAFNATVHPSPSLSATGSTVCSNGTIALQANTNAFSFGWTGPGGFAANVQNPVRYPVIVNHSGLYTVTVLSAQGCSNTAAVNVSVTQIPTPAIVSNGPQCAGSTINFIGSGVDTYAWLGPNGFASAASAPNINNVSAAANGIYTLTGYRGPCMVTTTHSLLIYPLPVPSASSSPVVCETKSLGLFASCAGTVSYFWVGPSGYNSQVQNPVRPNATNLYSGNYTVLATDNNGCQGSAITPVNILQNPVLTAFGTTVCLNQPGTIKVNGASGYFWTGPNYFQSGIQNPTITSVSKDREGTYTVVGTAANTCTSVTTVQVLTRVLPVPKIAINPNKAFCPGESFTLIGSGALNYHWSGPQALQFTGETFSYLISNAGQGGTYTLVAEDGFGCRNSATIFIKINDVPQGYLVSEDKSLCVPVCSKFTFVPMSNSALTSTWSLGVFNYNGSFSHCFSEAGEYVFKGLIYDPQTGCKNESSLNYVVQSRPQANFRYEPDVPVENSEINFIDMSEGNGIVSWKWYFADHLNTSKTVQNPGMLFTEAGNVPVALVVKNSMGCSDTIVRNIKIEEDLAIYIPNAFTPNADNLNEHFVPQLRGVKKYYLSVYDSWGKIIYEGSEADAGWDGTFAGSPCKSDVYNWKLQIAANSGETKTLMGHVSLLK